MGMVTLAMTTAPKTGKAKAQSPRNRRGEKAALLAADPSRDPSWPASYSRDLAERILKRIAAGESLRAICKDEPGAPDEAMVRQWEADNVDQFAPHYARARDRALEAMAEDVIAISDDPAIRLDPALVPAAKLRTDNRKWILSKLAPKKYGDRLQVDATVEHRFAAMDDRELTATMRDLADRLGFVAPPMLPALLGVAEPKEDEE